MFSGEIGSLQLRTSYVVAGTIGSGEMQIELVVPIVAGGTTAAWRPYQDLFQPGADGLAAHQGRDAAGARRLHRQRGGSEVSATGTGNIHQQCL